jgi:NAD(P)-dependent dehydrogenase (short-subunit alcohol dehydrogenase family)
MASNANLLTAKTQMTRAFTVMSFAVEGLSESLAQEVGPLGIRVVLISPSGFATDWAGNSAAETLPDSEIADYSDTAGAYRRNFRANAGKEAGDPKRAAVAIVDVAHDDAPPQRLPLGNFAYDGRFRTARTLRPARVRARARVQELYLTRQVCGVGCRGGPLSVWPPSTPRTVVG